MRAVSIGAPPFLLVLTVALAATAALMATAPAALAGKKVASVVGGANGAAGGQFGGPNGIAINETGAGGVPAGSFYVADGANERIQHFSADGEFIRLWGFDVIDGVTHPGAPNDNGTGFEICDTTAGNTPEQCKAGVRGSAAGQLALPTGLAVDSVTGNVYVMSNAGRRVEAFGPKGTFHGAFGWGVESGTAAFEFCTLSSGCNLGVAGEGGGQFRPLGENIAGVAVAPPAAPNAGNILIVDGQNRRVQEFQPTLDGQETVSGVNFVRAFGWDVVPGGTPSLDVCVSTAVGACQAGQPGEGGANPGQLRTHSPTDVNLNPAFSIAVDSGGHTYVSDPGNYRVVKYAPSGLSAIDFAPGILSETPSGNNTVPLSEALAVTPANDHVFVHKPIRFPGWDWRIVELDSDGNVLDTHMIGTNAGGNYEAPNLNGLAVNHSSEKVYGTSNVQRPGVPIQRVVFILDDDGQAPPVVSLAQATEVGASGATLAGEVHPQASPTGWYFEVSKSGVAGSWVTVGQGVVSGQTSVPVSTSATGLEANAIYRFRLRARKDFGGPEVLSPELILVTDTVPPEAVTEPPRQVSATDALLLGTVNPNNLASTYRFEYGLTTSYGQSVPLPEGSAAGGKFVEVGERIEGLKPGHTYQYRLCATNSEGEHCGSNRTFRTRTAVEPPAGRTYEMVTPPVKNDRRSGTNGPDEDNLANPGLPAPDGDSMLFRLHLGVLDPEASPAFPHLNDVTLIERGSDGWQAQPIHDVVPSVTGGTGIDAPVATSTDFRVQAWHQHAKLFSPTASGLTTLLRGDTGGLQGKGWYEWVPAPHSLPHFSEGFDKGRIDDEGERMVRWGGGNSGYRGLLGPSDPSKGQAEGTAGGDAVYLQEPPGTGGVELITRCTGSGESATTIPLRDQNGTPLGGPNFDQGGDDLIAAQTCEEGSVPSRHGGVFGANHTAPRAMSDDGRTIFFTSPDPKADPLQSCAILTQGNSGVAVGGATRCPPQIYVHRRVNGNATVRWISRPEVSGQSLALLGPATFEAASADGRTVYFRTNTPLTADDPNATGGAGPITEGAVSGASWDLYRYDLPEEIEEDPDNGTLTRITGGPNGNGDPNTNSPEGGGASVRFASDDGERVYFVTRAPIPGVDPTGPAGGVTQPGGTATSTTSRNLYLYDGHADGADRWRFIAQLPFTGSGPQTAKCAVHGDVSGFPMLSEHTKPTRWSEVNCMRGTPSGDALVFESAARLTEDDTDDAGDIFLYDVEADELTRISAPPPGSQPQVCSYQSEVPSQYCNADLGFAPPYMLASTLKESIGLNGFRQANLALDPDGRLLAVFFQSYLQLIPGDTNDQMDVYEWRNGKLSLVSPGSSDDHAYYSGNSRDGRDAFFHTSQRISPWEVDDGDYDIYNARVGGGLPGPPAQPVPCAVLSGACSNPASPAPLHPTSPTSTFRGAGNVNRPAARRPGTAVCVKQARVASKASRNARALLRRSRQAPRGKAKRLRSRAHRAARTAKRASLAAKRCRQARRTTATGRKSQ